ncbi:sensor histidine kinase [Sphingobium sp.]|uniref:sensor histidine kinase n=1 Tax=Sphingobium sp. TaxID=1912891 RepID=UPI002C2E46EC|nr:HWE histidine kinase domain-containing protein [Sphingobium sp.]HUD95318.1 HWE histidine kinase domain-containing protein [Sphingobium sp.]
MPSSVGRSDPDEIIRLLDENEQLRTALESALEENGRVVEDRDRLLTRIAVLGRELHALNLIKPAVPPEPQSTPSEAEMLVRQSQTDEELRVAFEELQVLTEELEVANTSLQKANSDLEVRVAGRTRELTEANSILRRTELRLSTLVNGIPQLVWRAGEGGQWTWASEQWEGFTGLSNEESRGFGWLEAFHPDDREGARRAWAQADRHNGFLFEGRLRLRDGGYRHFQTRASPVRAADGKILEWLGTCTDVDDILQLREQQSVLVDELQHRTRNLMAVVQAVMLRTIKGTRSLEEFRRCIDDRLEALARVQGLLSQRGSQRIAFDRLLRAELSAHVELDDDGNGKQIATSGPLGVPLATSLVQTFALALHELATNAVKYGALSQPTGLLEVGWDVTERPNGTHQLHVDWRERGVADMPDKDAVPRGGGYGRELIERALPYQLGAETSYGFTEDGVHCTISVPVAMDRKMMETING